MSTLPPSIRDFAQRYRTQAADIRRSSHEAHNLSSLAQRLLLSPSETLEQVSSGNLIALGSANGKHIFSSRSLDVMRNRVVDFITDEIYTEMSARGADEDRICFALSRAFQKQHDLSRRPENVVEFARTPNDDDDSHPLRNAALLAGAAGAGYLGYRALKNRGGNGPALPSGPQQPFLPPGPGPSGDSQGARHPGPPVGASIASKVTTQSPRTLGGSVIDPLTAAVQRGKASIARRGSSILAALKKIPLE